MLTLHLNLSRRLSRKRGLVREWRWHLAADNQRKIATSGEGYYAQGDALAGAMMTLGATVHASPMGIAELTRRSETGVPERIRLRVNRRSITVAELAETAPGVRA